MYCCLLLIYMWCDCLQWMEDRETQRMCKYRKWKDSNYDGTAWAGHTKFHADGFLFDCYAKGEFLQLNFLSNNMRNIGAVIAQLVTVWHDAIITSYVTSSSFLCLVSFASVFVRVCHSIGRSVSRFPQGNKHATQVVTIWIIEQRVLAVLHQLVFEPEQI